MYFIKLFYVILKFGYYHNNVKTIHSTQDFEV